MVTRDEAHRAALDHLLGLIAGSHWGGDLVLRGSMVLLAWLGERARPPADLDWILTDPRKPLFRSLDRCDEVYPPFDAYVDPLDPYPYVDDISQVQQWPEAAGGAARYRLWAEEEFGTFGTRPILPPEGLRWAHEGDFWPGEEFMVDTSLYDDLVAAVRRDPFAGRGVVLCPNDIGLDRQGWSGYPGGYGAPGARYLVPWIAGSEAGVVRVEIAADEYLPNEPVRTPIPRADGGAPTVVTTAGRGLSLAWKLLWLHTDATEGEGARGKDLYDAVLLAEYPKTRLPPQLMTTVFGDPARIRPADIPGWNVNWEQFIRQYPAVEGDLANWLHRLARAYAQLPARRRKQGREVTTVRPAR
ncbi:hypothetical protein [Nocardia sp. IFM 10818]